MTDTDKQSDLAYEVCTRSGDEGPRFDHRRRNAVIFAAVVIVCLILDQATKLYFNGFALGEVIAGPFLGVFDFRLVHNFGAAWGIFSNATFALGVVSLVVCALLVVYLFVLAPDSSRLGTVGIALVFAGGIGNAIDRFTLGYVVDFIEPVFIDFPVFNIADIGVTCGFVIFFISLALEFADEWKRERHPDARAASLDERRKGLK